MRIDAHRRRGRSLVALATLGLAAALVGCTDMKDQSRYEPLEASSFYADGQSARPLVEGTVARGQLRDDDRFHRGLGPDGKFVEDFPLPVTAELLARGRERFDIFCSPCHDRTGAGNGMIVRRGYKRPPSFHEARLRQVAPGYVFDVMSNGFGQMASYAAQVPVRDRWAITAYIRALQLSQYSPASNVPTDVRRRLDQGETVDTRAPSGEGHEPSGH